MQHSVALQTIEWQPLHTWCGLQPALTCTLTQLQAVECLEVALCEAATSRSRSGSGGSLSFIYVYNYVTSAILHTQAVAIEITGGASSYIIYI